MDKPQVTDLYFMDARSRLIELAAILDRLHRASGETDVRWHCLMDCLPILQDHAPEKTARILERMSDPTTAPIPTAGEKGACGVWPGYRRDHT